MAKRIENNIAKIESAGILALYPEYYNFTIFTDEQRRFLIEMLSTSKFQSYYQGIIRQLNNVNFNQNNLDNFWIRTEFTKTFKKYDAEEYLPELIKFLKS